MSFLLDRTYPPSFRGVDFIYISDDVSGGLKTVVHEFPNKSFRRIQELGLNLRTITIRAEISGFFYEDNKARFEDALNTPGIGILVHPTLGNINCKCVSWTVTQQLRKFNIATYSLTFMEENEGFAPRPDGSNISVIANLYRDLYEFIKDDLNGQYIANFARNISFAAQKLTELTDNMRGIRNTIGALAQSGSEFVNQLGNFASNVYRIASPDGDIGGQTSDIVDSFDSLSDDGQTRFDASSKLIGFGSQDQYVLIPTQELNERNNNLRLINGTINSLAFTNMVDGSKDIQYQDEDQLNAVINQLDVKYDDLINDDTNAFSNDLLDKINELRNQARVFFENTRLTVNKVVEVTTKPIPVAVLTYQYAGNTDDYDLILSLNQNFNPSRISGIVKIVEK